MTRHIKTENIYNVLVQTDYLVGLCTAYMLGASRWFMFVILLGASLILGILTVKTWAKLMREITRTPTH